MADAALVAVFLRQVAVDALARFITRAVHPGHVADGGGRTVLDALGLPVAEEALAGLLLLDVEGHHAPRAGLFAEVAADE